VFRAIWNASDSAMVLTDAAGTVLAANPAYCRLHRCSMGDLVGGSLALILPEAERPFAIAQYHAVFESLDAAERHSAAAQWRAGSDSVVESRMDLLMKDNRSVALLSTVRVIAEPRPGVPHAALPARHSPLVPRGSTGAAPDSDEPAQTTADTLIDAIDKWGIDAVVGQPGDGGKNGAEPADRGTSDSR
jgi:PAS domain S-box-containing protein